MTRDADDKKRRHSELVQRIAKLEERERFLADELARCGQQLVDASKANKLALRRERDRTARLQDTLDRLKRFIAETKRK